MATSEDPPGGLQGGSVGAAEEAGLLKVGGHQGGLKKACGTESGALEGPAAAVALRRKGGVRVLGVEAQAVAKFGDSEGVEEAPANSGMLWEAPVMGGAGLKCWLRWLNKGHRRHSLSPPGSDVPVCRRSP